MQFSYFVGPFDSQPLFVFLPCEDSVDVVLLQLLLCGHLVEEVVEALLLLLLARRVEVLVLVDLGGRGLQLGDLPLVDRLGDEEVVHGQRPEGRQELRRDVAPYLGRVQRPDGLDHCGAEFAFNRKNP